MVGGGHRNHLCMMVNSVYKLCILYFGTDLIIVFFISIFFSIKTMPKQMKQVSCSEIPARNLIYVTCV